MNSEKKIFAISIILSAFVFAFLIWLIYFRTAVTDNEVTFLAVLPTLNAFLNFLTSIFLVLGIYFIKKGKIEAHKKAMMTATLTSALFLISYIVYHYYHGDSKFLGTGIIRYVYLFILISHILLSMIQVPLILSTLFFAFSGKFINHRKIARWTFPVWLYVSVTGVLVFIFLNFLS